MKPTLRQFALALKVIGAALDETSVRYRSGRFEFPLQAGWSLRVRPDDAGRFRVEVVLHGSVRATMWCLATDHQRLAELAVAARDEALSLVD